MRQARVGLVMGVLAVAVTGGAGAAEPGLLQVAGPGRRMLGPDGKTPAEEVRLAPGLAAHLLRANVGEAVRVADWPVAVGERRHVTLVRQEVYAPDAVVYRVEGETFTPLPRSALAFFWGQADGEGVVRVLAVVDPATGTVTGSAHAAGGTSDLREGRAPGTHLVAATEAFLAGQEMDRQCAGSPEAEGREPRAPRPARAEEPLSPGGPLHTAVIGVDTDNELLNLKFANNTTSASNYIANLFASMNLMYERDLGVRLLVGTTFLRPSTAPDPYSATTTSGQLTEVRNYWSSTCGAPCSAPRAAAALLSGKSPNPNSASGIAYVDVLCSTGVGYSANQVFRSDFLSGDTMLVGHELGHNFGSTHTHCSPPSPFIDNCYNAQSGCYAGATSCPATQTYNGVTFRGSLMSYCHITPSGCGASPVFHPRTVNEILTATINDAVGTCLFPALNVTSVEPNTGPLTGAQRVTVRGSGFTGSTTVRFGGTLGTALTLVNSTTITVTTPAHAAGIVDVVVANSGTDTATLASGYFYQAPLASTRFYAVPPCRAVDTRSVNSPALAAGGVREFTVTGVAAGTCNLPANAVALAVTVTVARNSQGGHLTFFPANGIAPNASHINFRPNAARANSAILLVATDGSGRIRVRNGSPAAADLILDITGYFR